LKLNADLRADVGASDAGTLVALAAPDEARALALAEQAGMRLDKLVAAGALAGYESPARLLPSPGDPGRAPRRAARRSDPGDAPRRRHRRRPDRRGAARRLRRRRADRRAASPTSTAPRSPARRCARPSTRCWCRRRRQAVARVPEPAARRAADRCAAIRSALADLPDARVVHIKQELDGIYDRFLHEALLQAIAGAVAVCALLALHLRSARRLLQVAEPIAAAVVVVLGALTVAAPRSASSTSSACCSWSRSARTTRCSSTTCARPARSTRTPSPRSRSPT
jgi:predicted exporter